MSRAINIEALIAVVNNLADEADALAQQANAPANILCMEDRWADDVEDLVHALDYAMTAREILTGLAQGRISSFCVHPSVFGLRFAPELAELEL